MNDLGQIKRDVLSEIERDRKYAQISLETIIADTSMDYESKIKTIKRLISKLADSDVLANATNNIFIDNNQASQQQSTPQSEEQHPSDVVNALNQSHSE